MTSSVDAPGSEAWEEQLVRRAQAGDEDAFGSLLTHYQPRVYSLVRRLVRREEEAAEVTQEAFLQAFKARHRFAADRAFRPWLFKVAVNVCRNHLRAASRREQALGVVDGAQGMWQQEEASPESEALARDDARLVSRQLALLSPMERALLLLRYNEEMPYAELRRVYNVPESVLKMRVHRALERLRALARGRSSES